MSELLKKRSYDESSQDEAVGHRDPKQTSVHQRIRESSDAGDWQLVEGNSKKKFRRNRDKVRRKTAPSDKSRTQNASKASRPKSANDKGPAVTCAELHQLHSSLRISDLQQLVLYCLVDGVSPQWISVRHHHAVRRAVVLMVPGLEQGLFTGEIELGTDADGSGSAREVKVRETNGQREVAGSKTVFTSLRTNTNRSPDEFLPIHLDATHLPACLKPFAHVFSRLFPIKAPGDDKGDRLHSPVAAITTVPLPKTKENNSKGPKPVRVANDWKNKPTPVTNFITSAENLLENDYILHPALCTNEIDRTVNAQRRQRNGATAENGWKDAIITGREEMPMPPENTSLHDGRNVLAIDCEMCKVEGDVLALTRISIVDWDRRVVMDELVKPDKPVVDYLTAYSGITAEKLAHVTTNLPDIQSRLLKLFTPDTILIGHSLNADLSALKITHPYIIDTSIIYPHPRGAPMKSSLKWLTQKYLNREIQKQGGSLGHDSIEDAMACLDLVKAKCKHGPLWGTPEAAGESIFKRLARSPKWGVPALVDGVPSDGKLGAVVDHGRPERTIGASANVCIACNNDDEVATAIKRCANGDADGSVVPSGGVDLTFARMRELEALRGWSTDAAVHLAGAGSATGPSQEELRACLEKVSARIADIRASLPECTLFIVYSGVGDPREMKRLTDMQKQFRKEYAVKKWDEITVKWTDTEEQGLKRAVRMARAGIGFVTVT